MRGILSIKLKGYSVIFDSNVRFDKYYLNLYFRSTKSACFFFFLKKTLQAAAVFITAKLLGILQ